MKAVQWFPGKKIDGVLRIPAGTVDASKTRGIKFERPERHVVNTPFGQLEIGAGDWIIRYPSGALYVFKDADYDGLRSRASTIHGIVEKIKSVAR